MPERWQRELERLRDVSAPASVRSRIAAGPKGEGVPPVPGRRQRIAAGVVAFAVFGGAIALAWGVFGHRGATIAAPGQDVAVLTFAAHPTEGGANPTGTMAFGDESVEAFGTSFCWDFGGGSMCADTAEPHFVDSDFGSVPGGTHVAIEGDAQSVDGHVDAAGSFPFDRIRPLDTSDGSFVLPTQVGLYVIEFRAAWSQGARDFYFPIRIVDASAPPSTLVATLSAPSDGSMPGLVLAYDGLSRDYFAQGGVWPGVDAFDQPLLSFDRPIEPGSLIRADGDAVDVDATLRTVRDDGSLSGDEVPLDLLNGSARLPDEPGGFELVLTGTWERGTAVFHVRVQIGESSSRVAPTLPPSSSSAGDATMPDLVGLTDRQAMQILNELGIRGVVAYRHVGGDQWHVTVTDPATAAPLPQDTTVELVISTRITPLPPAPKTR